MLDAQLTEEAERTACKSPAHMQAWLEATGRHWLILPTAGLVDALPWPDGIVSLIMIVEAWRNYRRAQPSGEVRIEVLEGQDIEVPTYLDERLTLAETDRAIRFLVNQATELDPSWSLGDPPL